jgi:hypothetical protein
VVVDELGDLDEPNLGRDTVDADHSVATRSASDCRIFS